MPLGFARSVLAGGVAEPTYELLRSVSSVNEGNSVTYTLNTTNLENGTAVGYSISGINSDDVSSGSLSGNFVVSNNTGSVTITLAEDNTTEGTEYINFTLNNGATTVNTVTVNDTSLDRQGFGNNLSSDWTNLGNFANASAYARGLGVDYTFWSAPKLIVPVSQSTGAECKIYNVDQSTGALTYFRSITPSGGTGIRSFDIEKGGSTGNNSSYSVGGYAFQHGYNLSNLYMTQSSPPANFGVTGVTHDLSDFGGDSTSLWAGFGLFRGLTGNGNSQWWWASEGGGYPLTFFKYQRIDSNFPTATQSPHYTEGTVGYPAGNRGFTGSWHPNSYSLNGVYSLYLGRGQSGSILKYDLQSNGKMKWDQTVTMSSPNAFDNFTIVGNWMFGVAATASTSYVPVYYRLPMSIL